MYKSGMQKERANLPRLSTSDTIAEPLFSSSSSVHVSYPLMLQGQDSIQKM